MVELTKTKLRSIIGRWAASSYNSHTITAAIDEIIFHVEKDEPGFYQYYTAKKDGSYTALYQLTVTSSYALFHDVFKNKFYRLVKKWNAHRENFPVKFYLHVSFVFFNNSLYTFNAPSMQIVVIFLWY